MPDNCSAYGCKNKGNVKSDISYHQFPLLNKDRLQIWILKLKRKGFKPTKKSKICSDHFEKDCFEEGNYFHRRRLKPDAIPTKFSFPEGKYEWKNRNLVVNSEETKSGVSKNDENHEGIYNLNLEDIVDSEGTKSGDDEIDGSHERTDEDLKFRSNMCKMHVLKDACVQTENNVISILLEQNSVLQQQLDKVKLKIEQSSFRFHNIPEKNFKSFTGISKDKFLVVFKFLDLEKSLCSLNANIKPLDMFLMLLVYLRTGMTQAFLAQLFQVRQSAFSKIYRKVTDIVYGKVKNISIWPTKQVEETMPLPFLKLHPECRVIIDCAEFKIQQPTHSFLQRKTFSLHKKSHTLKGMVGITPSGAISFVTDLRCGSMSDKRVFLKSGVVNLLDTGDAILADKGFLDLQKIKGSLTLPNLSEKKFRFIRPQEKPENRMVAYHIERTIGRIKSFKYFSRSLPPPKINPNVNDKYFFIIAFLVNFKTPHTNPSNLQMMQCPVSNLE